MKKRLNVRFVVWLTVSIVVLAVATHFVHAYQVQRNAHTLLNLASVAESKGQLTEATNYLNRYLGLRPMDTEALVKLGKLLADERLANSLRAKYRALLILNKALYRAPDRDDVRRMAAKLAIEFGRYEDASRDIRILRDKYRNDAELELLLARCFENTAKYQDARTHLENAIQYKPTEVDAYTRLAFLLRQHSSEVLDKGKGEDVEKVKALADATMLQLVKANPQPFRAYLARAEYHRAFLPIRDDYWGGRETMIAADVGKAQELAPDEVEVILAAAELEREQKRFDVARGLLTRGCELHSRDWRMYKALARLDSADQPEAAMASLRRGLQQLENQPELLWDLAELEIRLGLKSEAEATILRFGNSDVPPAFRDCLSARLEMANEKWTEAADRLEKAFPALLDFETQHGDSLASHLATQAGLMLASCYEQLGDTDRALGTFGRLVARDAKSVPALLGVARSLSTLGQFQESIDHYQRLVLLPVKEAEAVRATGFFEIARMVLLRNLERPNLQRNWKEVDAAIKQAELIVPLPAEVVLLKAESLVNQGQIEQARALLLEKYGDPKTRPALIWVGLATLNRTGDEVAVDMAMLDEAERLIGDHVELRLTRARHWATAKSTDSKAELARLAENTDRFSPNDQRRLLRGLVSASLRAGDLPAATKLLEQVIRPDDVNGRLELLEIAAQAGDMKAMLKWQAEIQKIEKDDGVLGRYARARILIEKARSGDKSGLPDARTEIAAVAARRPNWPRVPLCEALIDDLDGKSNDALPNYLRAIQLGANDLFALLRAAELLYLNGRFDEANQLFVRAQEKTELTVDMRRVAADAALQSQDVTRAMELMSDKMHESKDYRQQLWLGRMYWNAGKKDVAKTAFEKARDLGENQTEAWVGLVQFLMATGQKAEAQAEVQLAERRLTGPESRSTLACCYEAIGNSKRAAELFQEGLRANPNDPKVLREFSDFCMRAGRMGDAQVHLRKLMEISRSTSRETFSHAKRALAYLLAIEGDPQKAREAIQLLKSEGTSDNDSSIEGIRDRRARAQLLAIQHGGPKRSEALNILEDMISQRQASPDDYLLAAQIHELMGNWAKARQRFQALLEQRSGITAIHLAVAARSLLRHKELDEAQNILRRLEQSQSDSLLTREIRSRILRAEGKSNEARALIQEYARTSGADVLAAAALLNEFEDFAAAEELIRQFAAQRTQPNSALVLIGFLIERKRFAEALELCDRAWEARADAAIAEAYVRILAGMAGDSSAIPRIESRLQAATAQFPDRLEFLVALATVCTFQGRHDDAVTLYRRVIEKDPRHVTALNNAAWLMALSGGQGTEALTYANFAVELSGENPGMVDTRAVAALSTGRRDKTEDAIRDLESIAPEHQTAVTFFHLAQAYTQAQRPRDAARAWQQAKKLGLNRNHVHVLEIPAFERLSKELN